MMAVRNPRLSAHVQGLKKPLVQSPGTKKLSERLWDSSEANQWKQNALSTYFVQGIGDGSLNPTAFGGYMVQDSVYCYMAKTSIDVACEKSPQGDLKTYLAKESIDYEEYYQDLFSKWHIENADGIKLSVECQSYADYEHQVAVTQDPIYLIVAMLPCMKLWPWLGKQLQSGDHGVYSEWFDNNFDPMYDGYKDLDNFIDDADASGTIDADRAMEVFLRCMEGEFQFFNSIQHMK